MANAAYLVPVGALYQALSDQGVIGSGFKINTYVGGTVSTPLQTFTDATGTVANTNPIILGSNGRFQNVNIWVPAGTFTKLVLTDANNNAIAGGTIDNLAAIGDISGFAFFAGPTTAESNAGLTAANLNLAYPVPDLRRYGADVTGVADSTTAINNCILASTAAAGVGQVYHPGGTILHNSTITVPNAITIYGYSRDDCVFTYPGTGDGWHNSNGPNSSGYAKVQFRGVKLASTNAANTGAAIEFNAGGFAYYQIIDCWLFGKWKYAAILDAVELCVVERCLLDLNGTPVAVVWIVNGGDRVGAQTPGFSNVIVIRDNQISSSGVGIGVLDDGGNNHEVAGNNFNNQSLPARFSGCNSLVLHANSFETHAATSAFDVLFSNVSNAGNVVGACTNVSLQGCTFAGDMVTTGSAQLAFQGPVYNISGITQAASAVITLSAITASNPYAGSTATPVTIQGVSGMTQINGLTGNVTATGGVSGAWTITVNINSGAFSAYTSGGTVEGTPFNISAISQANPCVVTINSTTAANPFSNITSSSDSPVTINGVTGMTQINGLSALVTATGGVSGAWTLTLGTVNSTAFTAYVSGGTVNNYHSGAAVQANCFTAVAGRGAAIDTTNLANSFCGYNVDLTVSSGATHYLSSGIHVDNLGNTLLAPQNGFAGSLGNASGQVAAEYYGDQRFRKIFTAGVQFKWAVAPYSASITFDLGTANHFDITATNGVAFTINSPSNAIGGNRYSVTIRNASGGALGAVTWGASTKVAAGIAYPATGQQRTYDFLVDSGAVSHQVTAAADVPN